MIRSFDQLFSKKEAEDAWSGLELAFDKIAKKEINSLSYQDLYNRAYQLIVNRYGDYAYQSLKQSLRRIFTSSVQKIRQSHRDLIIKTLVEIWDDVKYFVKIVSDIFLYMDKNHVPHKQLKSVKILSIETFRSLMFEENQDVSQLIQGVFLDEVKRDRDGQIIEKMKLKSALNLLFEIDLIQFASPAQTYAQMTSYTYVTSDKFYKSFFENRIQRDTQKYYAEEGQEKLKIMNVEQFLTHAKQRLDSEVDRIRTFMHPSSEKCLKETFINNVIVSHAAYCIKSENQGLLSFLEMNNFEIIKEMYDLFRQSQISNEIFQDGLVTFIQTKGQSILEEAKVNKLDETHLVLEKLIELYEQIDNYHKQCFNSGTVIQQQYLRVAIRDAFENVVNQDLYITVQLNKNLDLCFKKDFKTVSVDEADIKLKRNFYIFKLIKQKDVFENHYKKLLCKRLIEGTSLSDEFEKLFVSKMKMECGSSYTNKIESMFKDIETSKLEIVEFKKNTRQIAHNAQKPLLAAIDLEIQVLTLGHWPLQDPILFNLSDELKFWKVAFERHYVNKNKQKKLTWFNNLGFVDIRAHYPQSRKKEFITSTLQACILLFFNSQDNVTLSEISEKLEAPSEFIKKELQPLLQLQIILKTSSKKIPNQAEDTLLDDILGCNSSFQHRSYKLKLLMPQNMQDMFRSKNDISQSSATNKEDETIKDEAQFKEEVFLERKFVLESMIVRLMKARKYLEHNKLIDQVLGLAAQKHFIPDIPLIKQCIENLMSRDYLGRSEENQNIYMYKA